MRSIIKVCELRGKEISISDIVFKIGPRSNASGRIHSGKEVVELLITKDYKLAERKSHNINSYNDTRRNIDKSTTDEEKLCITDEMIDGRRSIVVYKPEWHKGIVGIVASRLADLTSTRLNSSHIQTYRISSSS